MSRIDELNKTAIAFFKKSGLTHTAVAVSGSEESLVLLNAAVTALGNENVVAIVADTGFIPESVIDIIERACDIVNIDRCILPVYLSCDMSDQVTKTADYKRQIFEDMLQECWLSGIDSLCYAVTDENADKDGNEVIATFDGVYAPFIG